MSTNPSGSQTLSDEIPAAVDLRSGEHIHGMDWTLSDEIRATLAEIDASIRRAHIDGPSALFD